jgi:hypothetical protein
VVITGHHATTLTMADLKVYADFNREFINAVKAAKKDRRTIDELANSWSVPDRFLAAGYTQPTPGTSGQGSARLRSNIELVWNELK